ncbi:hypothetical protein GBAR_LOCUS30668 [Geodia barretti]|uniref:Uncharacterized protein n=2 Tax=Geodia barretti TaxID=519541 RepID=A0AA35TXI1_GEOBA|nr:hypothetical protein GBAR_LOCUS30668 [Geodia barretti]
MVLLIQFLFMCFSLQGVRCEQPSLEPGPSLYVCPEETSVKFSCYGREINSMAWIAEPYVPANNPIRYASGHIATGSHPVYSRGFFVANLTNLHRSGASIHIADLTSELTVMTSGVNNGTSITCKTYRGLQSSQRSTFFYHAGLPVSKSNSITYQEKETYYTAVLKLGAMFDGGGVPIDHYIIQMVNGTQFETPGPTYSFDIMYNTTLSVNISAHNCAGYSLFHVHQIERNEDGYSDEVKPFSEKFQLHSYGISEDEDLTGNTQKPIITVSPTLLGANMLNSMTKVEYNEDYVHVSVATTRRSTQVPKSKLTPSRMSLVLAVVPVTCVSALFIFTITILAVVRTRKKVGTTCTNRTGVTKQGDDPPTPVDSNSVPHI